MPRSGLEIAVLGPGGVGGLLAALLRRSENSVTVLASEATCRSITEHGIRVESRLFGDFEVSVQTAQRLEKPVDVCLITVKSTQLRAALDRVPPDVLGDGLVVPLLNGIDHIELLRTIYAPSKVVAATIRVESMRDEPGRIRQTSPFASVELAPRPSVRDSAELLAAALKAAGLEVHIRDDEATILWQKLAFLAPLALLTTHERANAGAIRSLRRDDAHAVIREISAIAIAEGARIDPEAIIRLLDSVPEAMESSMQRDQAAGRELELDAIGGAVMRRGAHLGVPTPVTSRLVEDLRARPTERTS